MLLGFLLNQHVTTSCHPAGFFRRPQGPQPVQVAWLRYEAEGNGCGPSPPPSLWFPLIGFFDFPSSLPLVLAVEQTHASPFPPWPVSGGEFWAASLSPLWGSILVTLNLTSVRSSHYLTTSQWLRMGDGNVMEFRQWDANVMTKGTEGKRWVLRWKRLEMRMMIYCYYILFEIYLRYINKIVLHIKNRFCYCKSISKHA